MGAIISNQNKLSNLVIREQWEDVRYCRQQGEVLLTCAGGRPIEIGEVVYKEATSGNDEWLRCEAGVAPPASIVVAIVIDPEVQSAKFFNFPVNAGFGSNPIPMGNVVVDWSPTSTQTISLALLYRGACVIRQDALIFGSYNPTTDAGSINTLRNRLTSGGIRLDTSMQGLYLESRPFA